MEIKSIFEAFTQSTRTNTKAGGTGLGLSIGAAIAVAHSGELWAENNKNLGASIYLKLPISR